VNSKNGTTGFSLGSKAFPGIDQLSLERRPEAFDNRIVEASPLAGKTGADSLAGEFFLIVVTGVVASPVRLLDQSRRRLLLANGTPQRLHHKINLHVAVHGITDDALREAALHARQVEPAFVSGDVGNVNMPELVNGRDLEPFC